jgi:hypothetical protein
MYPRRAVWLLAAVLLFGLSYLLGPWSSSGAERLDANPQERAELGARAAVDAKDALMRRAQGADPTSQRTEVEGTLIRGRLRFPAGVEVPADAQVYAVERSRENSREARARLAELVRKGEQRADQVHSDGRFHVQLPGLDPFAHDWSIYAGAIGWVGSVVFPDPRPLAPAPEEEFEIWMKPVFGASIELVTPTGAQSKLNRRLLRESGGSGLYVHGRWSVRGPLSVDSPAALLSVPTGLPPLVGGQDPSIGLEGPELAIQLFSSDEWIEGEYHHMYQVELPGYEPIKETLRFGPLAKGDVPHHRLVLRPLEALGELRVYFDRAAWWNRELGSHGASGLKLRAFRLHAPEGIEDDEMELSLDGVPTNGELLLEGMPSGYYRLELIATHSRIALPISPAEVLVPAAGLAETRADCGGFGAVELLIAEGCEGEWSTGRLEFLALDQDQMRGFRSEAWPVFLGPLPSTESGVILVRSLDRKTPPRVADRLNHANEFEIVDGVTTRYSIQGIR